MRYQELSQDSSVKSIIGSQIFWIFKSLRTEHYWELCVHFLLACRLEQTVCNVFTCFNSKNNISNEHLEVARFHQPRVWMEENMRFLSNEFDENPVFSTHLEWRLSKNRVAVRSTTGPQNTSHASFLYPRQNSLCHSTTLKYKLISWATSWVRFKILSVWVQIWKLPPCQRLDVFRFPAEVRGRVDVSYFPVPLPSCSLEVPFQRHSQKRPRSFSMFSAPAPARWASAATREDRVSHSRELGRAFPIRANGEFPFHYLCPTEGPDCHTYSVPLAASVPSPTNSTFPGPMVGAEVHCVARGERQLIRDGSGE